MAQQTDTEWTDVQNAAELDAGDDVRVVQDSIYGGESAVLDSATVRDALEGTGLVNVQTATGRTKEVRFQDDGSVKVRGDCMTYTMQVEREVATDGGAVVQDGGEDEAEAQEAEQVAVAYEAVRSGDLKVEKGTVLEDSPYQHRTPQDDEVYVEVERDGSSVYLRVPLQGGNVYALHHATKRHDTRQGRLVDVVDTSEVEGSICVNCREWLDHFTPVNTGHATTGDSGCPHCLEAAPVRSVVHEVGDERTVTGGYVTSQRRDHGGSVTLEAAKAITEN